MLPTAPNPRKDPDGRRDPLALPTVGPGHAPSLADRLRAGVRAGTGTGTGGSRCAPTPGSGEQLRHHQGLGTPRQLLQVLYHVLLGDDPQDGPATDHVMLMTAGELRREGLPVIMIENARKN